MAETTIAQEARELAKRLPADDARFQKLADLLKRYPAEEAKCAKVIDAWPDAAAGIEVILLLIVKQAGGKKTLQPFVKRAEALADTAAAVEDTAKAVLAGKSPGKFKPFAADYQTLCDDVSSLVPDLSGEMRKRLVGYTTAERASADAARRWHVRLGQIATEGRALVAALAKETDRELVQLRKFVEARMVTVPKERMAALADIGG